MCDRIVRKSILKRPYQAIISIIVVWSFLLNAVFVNIASACGEMYTSQLRALAFAQRRPVRVIDLARTEEDIRRSIEGFMTGVGMIQELAGIGFKGSRIAKDIAGQNTEYGKIKAFNIGNIPAMEQRKLIARDLAPIIRGKAEQGDRTFTFYDIGFGTVPAELHQFLVTLYETIADSGEDMQNWEVVVCGIDATPRMIKTAQMYFDPNDGLRLKIKGKKLHITDLKIILTLLQVNVLDTEGLKLAIAEAGVPKADYALFRHVFYLTSKVEGQTYLRRGPLLRNELNIPEEVQSALAVQLACNNIFSMAKPGETRLVVEPSERLGVMNNMPVFLPPGCRIIPGYRGAGILVIDDPSAAQTSLRQFLASVKENAYIIDTSETFAGNMHELVAILSSPVHTDNAIRVVELLRELFIPELEERRKWMEAVLATVPEVPQARRLPHRNIRALFGGEAPQHFVGLVNDQRYFLLGQIAAAADRAGIKAEIFPAGVPRHMGLGDIRGPGVTQAGI